MYSIGFDPTLAKAAGWAVAHDGRIVAFGQTPVVCRDSAVDTQRDQLIALFATYAPCRVVLEHPIINTATIARQSPFGPAKIAGSMRATLDLAVLVGRLAETCYSAYVPCTLVNPASVKGAFLRVNAGKDEVRDLARLLLAEGAPDHTATKRPREHEADAILMALWRGQPGAAA